VHVHVLVCSCSVMCSWRCLCVHSDVENHIEAVCGTYATEKPFEEQQKLANAHGYKWSEFLRLPYFEPSRFVAVDPMHCLFLGTITHTARTTHAQRRMYTTGDKRMHIHHVIMHVPGHAKDFWFRILDYYPTTSNVRSGHMLVCACRRIHAE
jgi:hypothetical protein